jgi:shikimate kinase
MAARRKRSAPDGPPVVVLVGLSGAGKSTVGGLLARRWECPFIDLDREIERDAGRSVAEIFRREGETGFRVREAALTRRLRPAAPSVVAVGGGWMARPELRDAWPGAVRVWLRVDPAEAALRLAGTEEGRPLLAGDDAEARLAALLADRLPAYGLAEYTVDASRRTPEEAARVVADLLEARAEPPGGRDDDRSET